MRARLAAMAAVLLLAAGVAADSGAAAEGRFYFERGVRAYRQGRYTQALDAFLLAHEAAPNPRTLFNLARAAERSNRRALAFSSYEELLADASLTVERRAEVERRRDTLGRRLAVVRVTTDPPAATLYLDRRDRGVAGISPVRLPVTEAGTITVIAEHPDHRRAQAEVAVTLGGTAEVHLVLPPRVGALAVQTTPTVAEVELIPASGAEPPALHGPIPAGRYEVVARAPEHRDARAQVRVREGETTEVALTLTPIPRPTGRLLVDGVPGFEVYVDGRVVGTTPVAVSLPIGPHRVRLDGEDDDREVVVEAERPTYVDTRPQP